MASMEMIKSQPLKMLTLDGGGSKGIYSLGILYELQQSLGQPLTDFFDCFYGTSTGSIIAASLSLGKSVEHVKSMYLDCIPRVMSPLLASTRSRILKDTLRKEFQKSTFRECKKFLGVVATCSIQKRPKIFKSSDGGAHGCRGSFSSGFSCSIADAVCASCSAIPFFVRSDIQSQDKSSDYSLVDGGFSANNPTLFALIDAKGAFKRKDEDILVINVGTGTFSNKISPQLLLAGVPLLGPKNFIEFILEANSNTADIITELLFPNINIQRINEMFAENVIKTNLLESNPKVLLKLFDLGRSTFGKYEKRIKQRIAVV
jgi:patatin-like phospholipase/acyl hydrolase